MNNLEKIKAAWKMGWAAQFLYEGQICDVVSIMNNAVQVRILSDSSFKEFNKTFINEVEIKGFLYAGQLAGKDEIPEGQRFRLRSRGLIGIYASTWDKKLRIKFNEFDEMYYASREEVEPVFD